MKQWRRLSSAFLAQAPELEARPSLMESAAGPEAMALAAQAMRHNQEGLETQPSRRQLNEALMYLRDMDEDDMIDAVHEIVDSVSQVRLSASQATKAVPSY